jgi:hypothetical protein
MKITKRGIFVRRCMVCSKPLRTENRSGYCSNCNTKRQIAKFYGRLTK